MPAEAIKKNAGSREEPHTDNKAVNGYTAKIINIPETHADAGKVPFDDLNQPDDFTEAADSGADHSEPTPAGLFVVKRANQWIEESKDREPPKQLYKELWYEQEICILFADTNLGKSIFAVQVAIEIAADKITLYIDFELSDKQFEARYSDNYTNHFIFPDKFLRAELNPDMELPEGQTFESYVEIALPAMIKQTGAEVVIIDNITYLKNEMDKSKNALPLMKLLKAIKKDLGISFLVLAHTPKRDMSQPLTQNDLGGSKMLINFCDSAFAIGASQSDPAIRYIKQIKQRNCPQIYGADNVMVYQIEKPTNFLFMAFIAFSPEREHLKKLTERGTEKLKEQANILRSQGYTIREICTKLSLYWLCS